VWGEKVVLWESEEEFREPTEYLRKKGIVKVGTRHIVDVEKRDFDTVEVCSFSAVRYYYEDGRVEEPPQPGICATIPKEAIPTVIEELKKYL